MQFKTVYEPSTRSSGDLFEVQNIDDRNVQIFK